MADPKNVNWRRAQPAPKYLARRLRASFPEISETGIYNDRNVVGTNVKSSHAEGRGLDVHLDASNPREKGLGDQLFAALIRKALPLGISNVIWNRAIWSQAKGGPRPYSGANPHTDHLHIEFTRAGSQQAILRAIERDLAIIRSGREDLGYYKPLA